MSKKDKKSDQKSAFIRGPSGSIQPPDVQSYDPVTFESNRNRITQRKALRSWFKSAQSKELEYEGLTEVIIDPKQVAYNKKRRKK